MGLKNTEIKLDNPWNTYYTGQTINGQVIFTFDTPKKIRGIIIRFRGEANTQWTHTKNVKDTDGKSHTETETLTGHEQYFEIQYYLLGGKNSGEITLPPGTHSYPFTCALPPTLPSSFEGEWGHVRHTIKVTLDRPWKFDQETKMAFTVIAPLDLNLNPRLMEPFSTELEKNFCCLCCRSGPLSVIVKLPVTGYVSGQLIPITAECDNLSNVEINGLKVTLRKILKFHVNHPSRDSKYDKVKICEVSFDEVLPHESKTWQKTLEIPSLPPSNLANCGLIDLDYELKIEVDVDGPHTNLDGHIPIVLGTIPISSFQSPVPQTDVSAVVNQTQDFSMAPTQPVSPASSQNGVGGAVGWNMDHNAIPNMPPPKFVESMFSGSIADANDSQYTQMLGPDKFAPRYPVFTMNRN